MDAVRLLAVVMVIQAVWALIVVVVATRDDVADAALSVFYWSVGWWVAALVILFVNDAGRIL